MKDVWVRSGYGFKMRKPFVALTIGGDTSLQMSPDEARKVGGDLLACADAAEGDAFLFEFVKEKVGVADEAAARVLDDFRKWREARE